MLCTWGEVGGSGSRGTSAAAALLTARNDSSSVAVTRDVEEHGGWRRMVAVYICVLLMGEA